MASLQLNDVSKIYPSGTLALYKTQLALNDKEFIVITGGEHSGKSTLLKVIAGLEDATEGTNKIGNKVVNEIDVKERDVAVIFNTNTLNANLTVAENIGYGLKIRKTSQTVIDKRVDAIAEVMGLTDILGKKPKLLTAEQKQKVTLARAMVREPKLYLFDDPFSGLNEDLKQSLISLTRSLQARMQGTFIYVTKNVADALTMGTRVVILKDGFIQQIDTPSNLYDYPANSYVAFFVGSPTISFIRKALLVEEDGAVFAVCNDCKIALSEKVKNRIVEGYIGTNKQVTVGIRPEDAVVLPEGKYTATVTEVNQEGYIEGKLCENVFITATCKNAEKGASVNVEINSDKIYLFDEETQLSILSRDEGYEKTGYPEADVKPKSLQEEKELKKKHSPLKEDKKKRK
ncbi:MAG: ABC transporter ATP-binding protein [Clostridia bacterium]|nr:ABC transporter ATP-binding protein [Clostridia bacterium]